jgi:VanZ family protein
MQILANDKIRMTVKLTAHFLESRLGKAVLPVFMMLIILSGSLVPKWTADSPSFMVSVMKNSLHIPMYLFLTFVLFLYYRRRNYFTQRKRHTLYAAALSSFLFGIFIEFLQRFVPGRTADFFDIALNSWGIVIFVCLVRYYWYRERVYNILTYNPTAQQQEAVAHNIEVLMLRERLLHNSRPEDAFLVYIVSPQPLEGKSTVCTALRKAIAPVRRSLLVQLDSGIVLDEEDRPVATLHGELAMTGFLHEQRAKKNLVFLDGEAVLPRQHRFPVAPIAQAVDYILWVIAEGRTSNKDLAKAKEFLAATDQVQQGLIFNALLS